MGGELSFNSNVMSLTSNDGPDSSRLIVQSKWRRQLIDGLGQVYTPFAQLRGDVYQINDYAPFGTEENGGKLRGNAIAGAEYRYPFIATTGSVAHVFEPIAQIIVRPDSVGDQEDIPNEDALSLVFDDTILFQIDKFSGYDRIETGTRANVGVRYTAQLNSGAYARAVFGESFQLAGQNEFDEASGLGTDRSDYVGGLYIQANSNLAFSAQSRFDHDTLDIERTDLGSWAKYGPVELAVNYADVAAEPGLAGGDPREEVLASGALALTDVWSLIGKIRYDIDEELALTEALGLQYADDCFRLSVIYEETNIRDRDIEPEQRILVNFSLKYLGTYGTNTNTVGALTPSSEAGQ
jgi:LPS-assembly protein